MENYELEFSEKFVLHLQKHSDLISKFVASIIEDEQSKWTMDCLKFIEANTHLINQIYINYKIKLEKDFKKYKNEIVEDVVKSFKEKYEDKNIVEHDLLKTQGFFFDVQNVKKITLDHSRKIISFYHHDTYKKDIFYKNQSQCCNEFLTYSKILEDFEKNESKNLTDKNNGKS